MSLHYKPVLDGEKELMIVLGSIEDRVQNRVFRRAGKKACQAIGDRAKALTPRRDPRSKDGQGHLADRYYVKQKVYRYSKTTVHIVGARTKEHGSIAHLVEEGTNTRLTKHKTEYKRVLSHVRQRVRRVRTASGWTTKRETETVYKRRSAGSKYKGNGIALNRGRMPAFHPLARAVAETPVMEIYEQEIKLGLQRIADKQ